MSLVVVEQIGGSDLTRENSGKVSGTRTFLVYDDEGGSLTFNDAMNASGIPQLGSPHPESSAAIAGSFTIKEHADRTDTYEVSMSYSPEDEIDPDVGGGDPLDDDDDGGVIDGADSDSAVTAFTIRVGLSIIDIWKSAPNLPADINDPARLDIGGTLVSEGGYPISLATPTANISINQRFSGFFHAGYYFNKIGKRNSNYWRGFDIGSILFIGVDVTQDNYGFNEVQFQLAFDRWYHLRQVPERDEDGNPKIIIWPDDPNELNVFWKQPFKEQVHFGFLPY